jgi:coenzyme PQQ biosynthesis protein PqqD
VIRAMPIDERSVPKLAKKARLRFDRHSGKHMIVYPERGLELNATGAAIALRCDGSKSVAEIVADLAREYGVESASRATMASEVVTFLERLAKSGLLEP